MSDPPVLSPHYGRGKRIFNTNEKQRPNETGDPRAHVAYFADRRQVRFIEARCCELPITFGHPLVAQCPYEGETLFSKQRLAS